MVARMDALPTLTTTSVRIERSLLRDLKIATVEADTTVKRLILDGIRHVLALHRKRMARSDGQNGGQGGPMTDRIARQRRENRVTET